MFVCIPRTTEFDCTIVPARYITFAFPNPLSQDHHLCIVVLDSPSLSTARISTMWVPIPPGLESDWIFSTFSGHLQLVLSSTTPHHLSRLILIGNPLIHSTPPRIFPRPLLLALTPKSAFYRKGICNSEFPENPSLIYEDEVRKCKILEICEGPCAGEMLMESVVVETTTKEFRRRLRFKRMPNLVQTQMRILPKIELNSGELDNLEFVIDNSVLDLLVHPYLSPMVVCQSERRGNRK